MTKKILIILLSLICTVTCAIGLAACGVDGNGGSGGSSGNNGGNGDNGDNGGNNTHTTHNWSSTYTPDGDRHYQTCDGCDEKNYSDHVYVDGVCICGDVKGYDVLFRLNEDGESYCVTGIADETATEVEIPENYEDKPVTSIGDGAFEGCSSLTSITIPDGVTSFGDSAFKDCSNLTSIKIPDGVTSIGESAFEGCSNLTNITIPDGVTSISSCAFEGCSSLTSITIPNGVMSIGKSAFASCGIESAVIGNGVRIIGEEAFAGCSNLDSVTLGSSVMEIEDRAFANCSSLTSITIPASVIMLGAELFNGTPLSSVVFENTSNWTVNNIPPVKLVSTELSNPATAAQYLTNSIQQNGYMDYSWETSTEGLVYTLNADNESYSVTGIGTATGDVIVIARNYEGKPVTSIGDSAFYACTKLTSIIIPNGVTIIDQYAFYNCNSATSITIPDSVTSIGIAAFYSCSSLTSITFNGTKEQWNDITKDTEWNNMTGDYVIHCTDGDIAKGD